MPAYSNEELIAALEMHTVQLRGMFIMKKAADPALDKYRQAAIAVFQSKRTAKRGDFAQMCKNTLGEDMPNSTYKKVVGELAIFNGNSWVLKQGDEPQ